MTDYNSEVIDMLSVTAEAMQISLSANALLVMAGDLSMYSEQQIDCALVRLRRESRRLTIADIIERIDDGRPLPEAAWGMVPKSESDSVVWCDEMREAYTAAAPMIEAGDKVAARVAFLETYRAMLQVARAEARPLKWSPSLGSDDLGRGEALRVAVEKNRISRDHAITLLPSSTFKVKEGGRQLLEAARSYSTASLPAPNKPTQKSKEILNTLIDSLTDSGEYTNAAVNKRPDQQEIERVVRELR